MLLAACGSGGEAAPSPQPSFGTARETVVAFYQAHAEGREADAYALLSDLHDPLPLTSRERDALAPRPQAAGSRPCGSRE